MGRYGLAPSNNLDDSFIGNGWWRRAKDDSCAKQQRVK